MQGIAVGFLIEQTPASDVQSYPITFVRCKALNNQGYPVLDFGNGNYYSAGFLSISPNNGIVGQVPLKDEYFIECVSSDNNYGFVFSNDTSFTVRKCIADNNVTAIGTTGDPTIDGIVGEGFTDLGPSTTSTPTTPAISTSYFEGNKAYNNGMGSLFFGVNQNYNILVSTGTPPLLEVKVSTSSIVPMFPGVYYSEVHNVSTIK